MFWSMDSEDIAWQEVCVGRTTRLGNFWDRNTQNLESNMPEH